MKHVTKVHYHSVSKNLDVYFDDDSQAVFSCEFLRVHSPSAEVQGHGSGPMKLVFNKQSVGIKNFPNFVHYAFFLYFDAGHNRVLFRCKFFEKIPAHQATLWDEYLKRVSEHNNSKDSVPIKFIP